MVKIGSCQQLIIDFLSIAVLFFSFSFVLGVVITYAHRKYKADATKSTLVKIFLQIGKTSPFCARELR